MTEPRKPQAFSALEIEAKWYQYWEEHQCFHSEPDNRPSYTIVIPPPNVTGALHMGHAVNNVIQDVLIRYHRMGGYNACWVPGTDHAGIATQSVVEKRLRQEEGKSRHDIGREALLAKIWQWKELYGNRIIGQLKRLGCSCDWQRTRFTMDDWLSYAVRYVFLELFAEKLVYRGKRLINWCPGCRTALSNDELVYETVDANFWEIRYPLEGQSDEFITVATTRPETMLGDTAVAVNSQDVRYQKWIGKRCLLPLLNRPIPIIADDILADPKKGTGAVKVTPAHDPNDYACGQRNHLPMINILNDDGSLNDNAGPYRGMSAAAARAKVLADLKAQNLLGKTHKLQHDVAHCYRSHDIVEPYLSNQWFVRMEPLVALARKAVLDGEVTFFPKKRAEDYLRWLDQTPDWCISRQIWWGHRIPIWYCTKCYPGIVLDERGEPNLVPETAQPILPQTSSRNACPEACPQCGNKKLVQDPDVLDTWFSSQLWPLSTLGWPEETQDLKYYYPTQVLVTARDIIALWVARMVMMGMKFRGLRPFAHVLINPTVQDERGDIMSKTRGNGVDPLKLIVGGSDHIQGKDAFGDIPADRIEHYPSYGCDALRYGLMTMASGDVQDIRLIVQRSLRPDKEYDVSLPVLEEGRRFCNKIWQACHGVIFANCQEAKIVKKNSPHLEDIWLTDRLHHAVKGVSEMLDAYRLGEACEILYRFFWDDLCSWYLEIVKLRLWENDGKKSKQYAQTTLLKALHVFLRLLHPIMPHLSEELWHTLLPLLNAAGLEEKSENCIVAAWPEAKSYACDAQAVSVMELARGVTSAINNIRAEQKGIREGQKIPKVILTAANAEQLDVLQPLFEGIKKLTKVEEIAATPDVAKPPHSAVRMVQNITLYLPLTGLIDLDAEKTRIAKDVAKIEEQIKQLENKLANPNYTGKAKAEVVERDRARLEEFKERHKNLQKE
jgi:valyl-tRNA synthetase